MCKLEEEQRRREPSVLYTENIEVTLAKIHWRNRMTILGR